MIGSRKFLLASQEGIFLPESEVMDEAGDEKHFIIKGGRGEALACFPEHFKSLSRKGFLC